MKVKFSKHAECQLIERQISKTLVNRVLSKPQQIVPGTKGRKIAQSIIELDNVNMLIRVVYQERNDYFEVITVYYTTRIDKNWRDFDADTV